MRHQVDEVIARVEKIYKENWDILYWIVTYYEVDQTLENVLELMHGEDERVGEITVTTADILKQMFTEGHRCDLLNEYRDDTINGRPFEYYLRDLQRKKNEVAA